MEEVTEFADKHVLFDDGPQNFKNDAAIKLFGQIMSWFHANAPDYMYMAVEVMKFAVPSDEGTPWLLEGPGKATATLLETLVRPVSTKGQPELKALQGPKLSKALKINTAGGQIESQEPDKKKARKARGGGPKAGSNSKMVEAPDMVDEKPFIEDVASCMEFALKDIPTDRRMMMR